MKVHQRWRTPIIWSIGAHFTFPKHSITSERNCFNIQSFPARIYDLIYHMSMKLCYVWKIYMVLRMQCCKFGIDQCYSCEDIALFFPQSFDIFLVQAHRTWPVLMISRSWHYISCHWDACSNHLAISDSCKPLQRTRLQTACKTCRGEIFCCKFTMLTLPIITFLEKLIMKAISWCCLWRPNIEHLKPYLFYTKYSET